MLVSKCSLEEKKKKKHHVLGANSLLSQSQQPLALTPALSLSLNCGICRRQTRGTWLKLECCCNVGGLGAQQIFGSHLRWVAALGAGPKIGLELSRSMTLLEHRGKQQEVGLRPALLLLVRKLEQHGIGAGGLQEGKDTGHCERLKHRTGITRWGNKQMFLNVNGILWAPPSASASWAPLPINASRGRHTQRLKSRQSFAFFPERNLSGSEMLNITAK